MAKTATQQASTSQQDETKKQRKKQAKQEAKLMLLVEEQQKALRKAEGKVKKAQASIEEHTSQLRELEAKLAQLRSGQQPASEATNGTYAADSARLNDLSTPTEQVDAPPPVEGRADISDAPTASTSDETNESSNTPTPEPNSTPTPEESDLSIESGGGSIPIVTQNENAWPPPAIREEVAEAVVEEETHPSHVEHEVHSSDAGEASTEQGGTELDHHYGEA